MSIRPYRADDRAAVGMICLRTGAAGSDATGTTVDDDLLADVYAIPYVEYAPEFAFVVDDDDGAAGYVIAVPDTASFVGWYRDRWMPRLAGRYAHLEPATSADAVVRSAFDPDRMLIPELADYPAHLHINLLPGLQGRGLGRQLIERECAELAARGLAGVHLGVAAGNSGALAFYPRVGFTELFRDADAVVLGRRL